MKKVIVTGGAGFIGSNLVKYLLKKKYFVINIDKLSYSANPYNLKNLNKNNKDPELDLRPPTCFTHVHNFYISLLAESGIVGIILFLFLIYQLINVFIKERKIIEMPVFGILVPLISLLVPMIPSLNYFSNWNAILIWLLVGWALSYTKHIKTT